MVVGLIALFTVLFFGGSTEYYFVDKLEKGVKVYVDNKSTQKDILNDLKGITNIVKDFNKNRKEELKSLKSMNIDYNATTADFESFFAKLADERTTLQTTVIEQRLKTVAKIRDEEWDQIIALSDEKVEKTMAKKAKKKEKDSFQNVENSIRDNVKREEHLTAALNSFNMLKSTFLSLETQLAMVNSKQNKSIANKNTSKEQMLLESQELNSIRKIAYTALQDFHFQIKAVTDQESFEKIMKEQNKLLN